MISEGVPLALAMGAFIGLAIGFALGWLTAGIKDDD